MASVSNKKNNNTDDSSPSYLIPFVLVTSLFFLWAFVHNLEPILIPHLKKACQLSDLQSALIDSSSETTQHNTGMADSRLWSRESLPLPHRDSIRQVHGPAHNPRVDHPSLSSLIYLPRSSCIIPVYSPSRDSFDCICQTSVWICMEVAFRLASPVVLLYTVIERKLRRYLVFADSILYEGS